VLPLQHCLISLVLIVSRNGQSMLIIASVSAVSPRLNIVLIRGVMRLLPLAPSYVIPAMSTVVVLCLAQSVTDWQGI
jgi:hypothetical protein